MYLKEMGSVPLLSREEEVEISKRIEKAQIQIEKIIMRFRYSTYEAVSIINYLIHNKERFDKCITEKEILNKADFLALMPRLMELLKKEDSHFEELLLQLENVQLKKNDHHAGA
jgi:RNA polymerase primary sigma factor